MAGGGGGGGWLAGWLENLILMKTQSSALTWTWTLDFDLGFVNILKKSGEIIDLDMKPGKPIWNQSWD